jgi:hypothetical protein
MLVAELARRVEQGATHLRAVGVGPHQELRSGGWRERHGTDELRVITEPVLVVCVRPSPVEDVLAVGVRLEVQGHRAKDTALLLADQIHGRPSGPAPDAARPLQREQELVVEEGKVRRFQVPPF